MASGWGIKGRETVAVKIMLTTTISAPELPKERYTSYTTPTLSFNWIADVIIIKRGKKSALVVAGRTEATSRKISL